MAHRFSAFYPNNPEDIETPTREVPLFYNVAGCVARESSLLLDYDDLLRLLEGMLSAPKLPERLRNTLGDTKSFLFLGFQFDRWHTQLLLRLLNMRQAVRRIATRTHLPDDDTLAFLLNQFKIKFLGADRDLLHELHQACAAEGILRHTTPPAGGRQGDVIFLLQKGHVEKAAENLLAAAQNTPLADDAALLLGQVNALIREKPNLDTRDFFPRQNRLAHLPETERAAARRVIEDGLVRYDPFTDEGRRLSVDGQALLKDFEGVGLSTDLLRELENTFLVRREPNTLGGHNYELSHDTLLAPVVRAKKQRMAEEEEQRRAAEEAAERERQRQEREKIARARRRNAVVGLFALALLLFAFYQMNTASDAKRQAKTEQQNADKAKREAADATEEAERQQRIADLAKKDALTLAEKAELAELKAQSEQAKAARANREVAEKSKIFVLNLLEKADEDIYRLKYEDALKKIQAAASIGPEKVAVARAFMEIAYWNAETGRLGPAQTAAAEAARLLGRADLAASTAKAADRLALQDALARLDNARFVLLETRYFPDFVRIPGGEFMMGSPEGIGGSDEQPEHPVRLSDFRLARTETTFWQFALYTENNKLDIQTFAPSWGIGGNHPVVNVSWYDAVRYVNWLSAREGRKPACLFEGDDFKEIDFDANGYRLPTEAQWEYAARSGGKNEVYAGFSETAELYLYANFCDAACEYSSDKSQNDGYRYTSPAGQYKPNGLELFDMSGNVWEWCQDWIAPYDSTLQINPVGPKEGDGRVIRGGGWDNGARHCRAAVRANSPDYRYDDIGFRLVRPF